MSVNSWLIRCECIWQERISRTRSYFPYLSMMRLIVSGIRGTFHKTKCLIFSWGRWYPILIVFQDESSHSRSVFPMKNSIVHIFYFNLLGSDVPSICIKFFFFLLEFLVNGHISADIASKAAWSPPYRCAENTDDVWRYPNWYDIFPNALNV